MLHFNYTIDSELKAPMGTAIPSGIQTQAFQIALTRLERRYNEIKAMLTRPTATGAAAIEGLHPAWRERLRAESTFVAALPQRLMHVAYGFAMGNSGDALKQMRLSGNWNDWAPEALQLYAKTLLAFQQDVNKALGNEPSMTVPEVYAQIAAFALLQGAPALPAVPPQVILRGRSLAGLGLDPDYLAQVPVDDPQYLGEMPWQASAAILGIAAGGLGLWYLLSRRQGSFY